MMGSDPLSLRRFTTGRALILLLTGGVAWFILSRVPVRDLTGDHLLTPSPGIQTVLARLPARVIATVYDSRSGHRDDWRFRMTGFRLRSLLQNLAAQQPGQIEIIERNPTVDPAALLDARRAGLRSSGSRQIWLGVELRMNERRSTVPLFDPDREGALEFELARALYSLADPVKPVVGVLSSLSLAGAHQDPRIRLQRESALMQALRPWFSIKEVNEAADLKESRPKVLLVLHPKKLRPGLKYAVDQYLLSGGHLIVALDPFSRAGLQNGRQEAMVDGQLPVDQSHFPEFLRAWGVDFDPGVMVGDPRHATTIEAMGQVTPYPYYLSLGPENLQGEPVIGRGIARLLLAESGSFSRREGVSSPAFVPLLQTSQTSGVIAARQVHAQNPEELSRSFQSDKKRRYPAVLLHGTFTSAFPQGPPPGFNRSMHAAGGHGKVILLGDVDFMLDHVAVQQVNAEEDVFLAEANDNLRFFVNLAMFLGGDPDLLSVPFSPMAFRPLTRQDALRRQLAETWKPRDAGLTADLERIRADISQREAMAGTVGKKKADMRRSMKSLREEEYLVAKKRLELRQDYLFAVERPVRVTRWVLLLIVPLCLCLPGFYLLLYRGGLTGGSRERRRHPGNPAQLSHG